MQNQHDLLDWKDITDNIMIIKVNRSYKPGMSEQEKYDVTRGMWKLNLERAERVKYALSVYFGEVIEVYAPTSWHKGGETLKLTRDIDILDSNRERMHYQGRYEFVGKVAPQKVRSRYVGKSVAPLFKRGEANPIKFIFPNEIALASEKGTLQNKQKAGHRTSRVINAQLRYKILKRDNFKCCACGATPAKDPSVELQVDHIKPWSKGGETVEDNLQTLCQKCNYGKSDL